jgi:hypothetical protein
MEIGGWFKPNLLQANHSQQNTSSGSWGIVQIPPFVGPNRPDLKYPPTAVGGITNRQLVHPRRPHLNDPPISIGGIKNAFHFFSSLLGNRCMGQ